MTYYEVAQHRQLRMASAVGADGPDWRALSVEELLDVLPDLDAQVSDSLGELRACVEQLRRRRASWREIGEALNVSRQAAWQRFHSSAAGETG